MWFVLRLLRFKKWNKVFFCTSGVEKVLCEPGACPCELYGEFLTQGTQRLHKARGF